MYVVLLDGYPRHDTMAAFGHDNAPFLGDLEDRGFTVDRDSLSNYAKTWFTLVTMFHMRHLDDIELPPIESATEDVRVINRALNEAPSLDLLTSRGYDILSLPPPYADLQLWSVTDRLALPHLNSFEMGLIDAHLPAPISHALERTVFADHARAWSIDTFERIREIARSSQSRPRFVFAHLPLPHTPILFNADGPVALDSACYPETCPFQEHIADEIGLSVPEFWDAYAGQVAWTNARLLEVVDAITEASPDAVVVLVSDHGSRYAPDTDPEERYRNLFAARTPGEPDLFGQGSTPVNVLSAVFNAYLGTDYAIQPDDQFTGDLPAIERVEP